MRLLLLAGEFYPSTSGGAHLMWHFSRLAAEKGHDITVFTPREEETTASEQVSGVNIKRPFRSNPDWLPAYTRLALPFRIFYSVILAVYLIWWLQGREFDGVYSTSHSEHWVGKIVSAVYGFQYATFVGYSPSVTPTEGFSPMRMLEGINFRFFMGDIAFCQTPLVKEAIESRSTASVRILLGTLFPQKIRKAVDEAEPKKTRAQYNIKDGEKFLLYVGRFVPIKNIPGTIDLLRELPPEYNLVIVGDGPEFGNIEELIQHHGLKERVVLTGELPHDQTLKTIAAADALVLTSNAESYPTVVFEALGLGVPVFVPPVGVLPELDEPLMYVADHDRLSDEIREAELNPERGVNESVLESHSIERYTNDVLSSFDAATG